MDKLKFPCLTRDFIHASLYSASSGYFMKDSHQLGALSQPLKYNDLTGIYNYTQLLGQHYPKFAFLTPVEIFQPWYGHSIGNYCLKMLKSNNLKILEIGGGTGTCALSILDFLKKHSYSHYLSVDYTICEISPVLANICSKRLKAEHTKLIERNQVRVLNKSILNWNVQSSDQTFIIGLEILDNFPCDRIWKKDQKWSLQTRVNQDLSEIKEELTDELIKKTLNCYLKMPQKTQTEIEAENREGIIYSLISYWRNPRNPDNMFLPTMTYKMFEVLCKHFKHPNFILADFDSLPTNKIKGIDAPIVSQKGELSHEKIDYDAYTSNFGNVDIFFPVNFRLLQQFSREFRGESGRVLKSYAFMEEYAKENWTQLKTGYRPLFDDFRNTSFFISN